MKSSNVLVALILAVLLSLSRSVSFASSIASTNSTYRVTICTYPEARVLVLIYQGPQRIGVPSAGSMLEFLRDKFSNVSSCKISVPNSSPGNYTIVFKDCNLYAIGANESVVLNLSRYGVEIYISPGDTFPRNGTVELIARPCPGSVYTAMKLLVENCTYYPDLESYLCENSIWKLNSGKLELQMSNHTYTILGLVLVPSETLSSSSKNLTAQRTPANLSQALPGGFGGSSIWRAWTARALGVIVLGAALGFVWKRLRG